MNRTEFENFKNYVNTSNRSEDIIKFFYNLNNLYNEVEDYLVHLKPTINPEIYQSYVDSLIYDINRIKLEPSYNSKVNYRLKKHNTKKSEFLKWHDIIPQNNILYTILNTELEMHSNIYFPDETHYSTLNNYTYQEIQEIQHFFKAYIINIYFDKLKNKLNEFIKNKHINEKQKIKNKPFISYFNPPFNTPDFLNQLKKIFHTESKLKGKGYAIMTYSLNKNNCIDIKGGFIPFMRSWYEFIKIKHQSNESFYGTSKHLRIFYNNNIDKYLIDFKIIAENYKVYKTFENKLLKHPVFSIKKS